MKLSFIPCILSASLLLGSVPFAKAQSPVDSQTPVEPQGDSPLLKLSADSALAELLDQVLPTASTSIFSQQNKVVLSDVNGSGLVITCSSTFRASRVPDRPSVFHGCKIEAAQASDAGLEHWTVLQLLEKGGAIQVPPSAPTPAPVPKPCNPHGRIPCDF